MPNATQAKTGENQTTLADRARHAVQGAQARMSSASSATVDAAKSRPYAAAGIVAGAVAAIGGAAYAASRRGSSTTDHGAGNTRH